MKTLKTLLAAIVFVGLTTGAVAQNTDNASAEATTRVISAIEVSQAADIAWGDVNRDTSPVLDPVAGTADNTVDNDDFSIGKFEISGADDADVMITWDGTIELTHAQGATMDWTPDVSFDNDDDANEGDFGGALINSGNGDNTLSSGGEGFVWVGGGFNVDENQQPGNYDATFVLTVEYE